MGSRRISVRYGSTQSELLVFEDEVGRDSCGCGMHLSAYLKQAADVAASLGGRKPGAPIIARVPQDMRLTFSSTGPSTDSIDSDQLHRRESMRLACEEAKLRERAAEAYEQGMSRRAGIGGAPPPPAGTSTTHLGSATATSTHCQVSASPSPRNRYQASVSPSPRSHFQGRAASSPSSAPVSPRGRCSSFVSPSVNATNNPSTVGSNGGAAHGSHMMHLDNVPPPF